MEEDDCIELTTMVIDGSVHDHVLKDQCGVVAESRLELLVRRWHALLDAILFHPVVLALAAFVQLAIFLPLSISFRSYCNESIGKSEQVILVDKKTDRTALCIITGVSNLVLLVLLFFLTRRVEPSPLKDRAHSFLVATWSVTTFRALKIMEMWCIPGHSRAAVIILTEGIDILITFLSAVAAMAAIAFIDTGWCVLSKRSFNFGINLFLEVGVVTSVHVFLRSSLCFLLAIFKFIAFQKNTITTMWLVFRIMCFLNIFYFLGLIFAYSVAMKRIMNLTILAESARPLRKLIIMFLTVCIVHDAVIVLGRCAGLAVIANKHISPAIAFFRTYSYSFMSFIGPRVMGVIAVFLAKSDKSIAIDADISTETIEDN